MKNIKIVIGANFGDEGKGLMTDYFTQEHNSIVVCTNGGAQRGHTVVTPEGIRHVFHHFGSGTLNGADTYLSEKFIINPILFHIEYEALTKLGVNPAIFINEHCRITTPLDMMANQLHEGLRGSRKHGSCGLGIYETIKRYGQGVCESLDFVKIRCYYEEIFEREKVIMPDDWKKLFYDDRIWDTYIKDYLFLQSQSIIAADEHLKKYDNIVFEAGQGLLLDQNNNGYFPHLTPSNTGIANPKAVIQRIAWEEAIDIETCYVSRTYMTRHGAGKFPTECDIRQLNPYLSDKTNVSNVHQGTLRYGYLVLKDLYERCSSDLGNFSSIKSLAITHCNEYPVDKKVLGELFQEWEIYYSDGETHRDVVRCQHK